jgi:predicted acetyltransferase
MAGLEIITADDDATWEEFTLVDAEAFTVPVDSSREWMAALRNHQLLRVARRDGRVVGGYSLGRVGQQFGGRDVPAAPVTAVVVRPEERGQGVGAALMADLAAQARDQGAALAPLWAAAPRFYRRWGWGVGERTVRTTVRIDALAGLRGRGRPERDPAPDQWLTLWRSHIEPYDGAFMPADWAIAESGPPAAGEHRYELGWREDGALTGYLRMKQKRGGEHGTVITEVSRFAALTGDAMRGLLGVLGGGDSMGEDVEFNFHALPSRNALQHMLGDPHRELLRARGAMVWMQRFVDLPAALARRGWDAGARGRVDLALQDPLESQAIRLRLDVEDGAVRPVEGGDGSLVTDTGTFAAWYSGGLSALQAQRMGLLNGPESAIALLDSMLPRREVWLSEFF